MKPKKNLKNGSKSIILDTKSRLLALEEELRKEEFVSEKHRSSIWLDDKGRYTTYVNGKKVSSNKKEKLIQKLYEHYTKEIKNYTFEELFIEWSEKRVKDEKIVESTHARYVRVFKRLSGNSR